MSCTIKPISMAANASLIPVPSLFAKAKASYSHSILTIPLKPVKLQLTLPTIRNKIPNLRFSVVASVQEENNPVLVEEEEGEELQGDYSWDGQESSEEEFEGGEESDEGVVASGDAGDYVEPSEEAKLYVGNLPFDVDSERLAQFFEQAGVVEVCEVVYNRVTDQSRGFAFVTMSTVEEAEKAVETFNGYNLNGRRLVVNKAAPRGSRPERQPRTYEAANRIFVGNLPWTVRDAELEEIFSEHGKVVSARVVADRETGRSRGFGFVVMATESEMNDAIANLDGQSVEGRVIRVSVAESRS